MNRREFLKESLSLGGLVATSALPSFGRGILEQLSQVHVKIEAGASAPFSVLHISDTHLAFCDREERPGLMEHARKRTELFGGMQEEALRTSIAWAKEHTDYLVHTGDIIDFVSEANLRKVRECFGDAAGAVTGSAGNHEYQERCESPKATGLTEAAFRARHAAEVDAVLPFAAGFSSTVVNGVNFVAIDDAYRRITAEQMTKFEAEVKKGLPIVLLMHVPPFTERLCEAKTKYFNLTGKYRGPQLADRAKGSFIGCGFDAPTDDFLRYLRSEKALKGILAGHIHLTAQDRFSPTAMEYVIGGNFLHAAEEVMIV